MYICSRDLLNKYVRKLFPKLRDENITKNFLSSHSLSLSLSLSLTHTNTHTHTHTHSCVQFLTSFPHTCPLIIQGNLYRGKVMVPHVQSSTSSGLGGSFKSGCYLQHMLHNLLHNYALFGPLENFLYFLYQ